MGGTDPEPLVVASRDVGHPGGVPGQRRIVLPPRLGVGQRPGVGRLVGARRPHAHPPGEACGGEVRPRGTQRLDEGGQAPGQLGQVGGVVRLARRRVSLSRSKGGAEVEDTVRRRGHIAAGAHHTTQGGGVFGERKLTDLAAHWLQGQGGALGEAGGLAGSGDHHLVGPKHLAVGQAQAPAVGVPLQRRHLALPEGDARGGGQARAERERPDPGGTGVVQGRPRHLDAGHRAGRLGVEAAHHALGQRVIGQEARLARLLLLAQGQLQHAAGTPQPLFGVEPFEPASAVQQPGQVGAALQVGVHGQLHVERPLQMGLAEAGAVEAVDQGDRDAAPGQGGGGAGPGNAGADHRHTAGWPGGGRREPGGAGSPLIQRWRGDLAGEHLTLAAEARHLAPGKACRGQAALDDPGAGEGGEGGAGVRAGGHGGKQLGAPHLGVPGRGEAVQEPGVDPAVEQPQPLGGIAEVQVQGHPLIQPQAVHPGHRLGPLGDQRRGAGGEVGPGGERPGQVLAGEREPFGGDQVQPGIRWGLGLEAGPGTEHVEAGTEAGLADHEGACLSPGPEAFGQAVAAEEDVLGLGAAVVAREVDIVKGGGAGGRFAAVVALPVQAGGLQGGERGQAIGGSGHGGSVGGHGWSGSDQWRRGGLSSRLGKAIRGVSTVLSTDSVQNPPVDRAPRQARVRAGPS